MPIGIEASKVSISNIMDSNNNFIFLKDNESTDFKQRSRFTHGCHYK